jgi:hypothetical protein
MPREPPLISATLVSTRPTTRHATRENRAIRTCSKTPIVAALGLSGIVRNNVTTSPPGGGTGCKRR